MYYLGYKNLAGPLERADESNEHEQKCTEEQNTYLIVKRFPDVTV